MESHTYRTLKDGERVSSTYAEIYFDDDYCEHKIIKDKPPPPKISKRRQTIVSQFGFKDDWVSPSDLLIGVVQLTPPFTSKITRGTTHDGILRIANALLATERAEFEMELNQLLRNNEASWIALLTYEKQRVKSKVSRIYDKIFEAKSKTLSEEISAFYEETLQELEDHMRSEIQHVLTAAYTNIISDLNTEIQQKLQKERTTLEQTLQKQYNCEVYKIRTYYHLLLQNEKNRNKKLVNRALCERNDLLNAFYKQIEAETVTSTMYVMSLERKKCKINQFILSNYQTTEIKEKLQKIKQKQELLDAYKGKEHHVSDINFEWECKIKKVVQLFLKFISYSLQLLPEQTTFLLDLEKMGVLQLNEIQKQPIFAPPILIESSDIETFFHFAPAEAPETICDKKPFVIVGDTSDPVPPRYGSRETLPSEVDLPTIRLQREFVYAKCHKYEEIKTLLESQYCKCLDTPSEKHSNVSVAITSKPVEQNETVQSESSNESMVVKDIKRIDQCPLRKCQDWLKRFSFPHLDSYIDFTETNYNRVKTMLSTPVSVVTPELIDAKNITFEKLPFSATMERHHHAETQYSSQEDLLLPDMPHCSCDDTNVKRSKSLQERKSLVPIQEKESSHYSIKESMSKSKLIEEVLTKRKNSLRNMLQSHPKLLKLLTDESFDFQL